MGIMHCDLKPENILIDSFGNACIAEFGVSYIDSKPPLRRGVCYISTPPGTLDFLSPEARQGCFDYMIDYWALGLIMFLLVKGGVSLR